MGFRKYNRKSVFVTLFLSFVLILFFPLIIESGLYYRMESIIKNNANRSNVAMLNQVSQVVDNRLEEVHKLAMQVSFNPKLQWLLRRSESLGRQDAYRYVNLMDDLKNYKILNGFIHDFYVYIPRQDVVVTPFAKSDAEMFYRYYYRYENMTYTEWQDALLQSDHVMSYLPSKIVQQGISLRTEDVISYIQPLPFGEAAQAKGSLVILINEQQIKNLLKNIEWVNRGDIYILDQHDQPIMTTANKPVSLSGIHSKITQSSGIFEHGVDDQEVMVSYATSQQTGWKYISVVPRSVFMEKVNSVKTLAIMLLILCLVIGLAGAYMLAYRHYIPVRDLVRSIMKNKSAETNVTSNEFHLIKETLHHTRDTEKQLRDVISRHTPTVRANFLTRLVKGFVDESAVTAKSLDFMDIEFTSEHFAVVVVDVDDCSQFAVADSERQWAIVRFIIQNVSKELADRYHNGYIVELDRSRLAVLINVDEERRSCINDDLDTVVNTLKEVVEERFKIYITIGVGNVCEGIDRIGNAYGEAIQALEYRMIKGQSTITYFHEIQDAEQSYYYPIEVELQLINFIKTGDFKSADQILDNVYRINFQSRQISLELGTCLFFNIMSTLVKILNDMTVQYEDVFPQSTDPIKQLAECRTAEEMHAKIKVIYQRLCLYIETNRSDHSEQLLDNITRYIETHYADSNLSLTSMSEAFGVTPQYLSSFFKKHQGENLTHFIAKVRIEHAKRMLQDRTMTIVQVARKIGYANDVGLIRLFKKYEGITPGKYRERIEVEVKSS